jgi:predicted lipid-binding transport protein (Tim44 family)
LNPVDEPFLTNGGGTSELATMMHAMPGLEDYLESSEELLRSLAEEEAEIQAEQGFMQNLVTPLGIGSMLLLLLSSAMFGYVVMNPSTLTRLLTARTVSSTQVPLKSSGPSESTGEIASAPNPNLAAQEFKQLNLNTLGTVKTNQNPASGISTSPTASPTPTSSPTPLSTRLGASGNSTTTPILSPPQLQPSSPMPIVEAPVRSPQNYPPVQPANSYPPPVVAPPSSRSSYTPPATPYRSPAQEPSLPTTTPAPPVSPAPPNNNSSSEASYPYKIVTHYANDHSLEAARKAVPDAFVPNFPDAGAKIQLGAYQDANSAEARVQELRRQGIAAEVYKP